VRAVLLFHIIPGLIDDLIIVLITPLKPSEDIFASAVIHR
jgi:hypothetical protein